MRLVVRLVVRLAARALASLALLAGAASAQDRAAAPATRAPTALFAADSAINITLVADWRALGNDRDTLRPVLRPGSLTYVDGGHTVQIPVRISTRGHFRLARSNCQFPPLRVVFDSGTRRTLFADQRALKLGTHCNANELYEQYVLREHLAYRAHNLVTDHSFRSRLARVRYVDSRDTTRVVERWGRFLESERDLARRVRGRIMEEARGGRYAELDEGSAALLGVWEYFLGNTDFSLGALHNIRLVANDAGTLAIPYDFDFSGLVDTRYAAPDARLPIKSVRQRYYRGPCLTEPQLTPILARFTANRAAIVALYDSLPALDKNYARRAVRYIEDFYDDIKKPGDFAKRLKDSCAPGS